ncbi:MAG: glutathione synthase [Gammaproteobacteria bacterium]|nr:glutathione synthase [Gammaproteobacteria bacterium]
MTIQLGVVMDPIASIKQKKDSTLAMLLAAQKRGWTLHYMLQKDLYLRDGVAAAAMQTVTVADDPQHWFDLQPAVEKPLSELDLILMRVDPPYNMEYIYTCNLLQRAVDSGVLVVNRPDSLRLINEKLFINWFSEFCPPTLVTAESSRLRAFLDEYRDIVIKPLDGMGGQSIFRIQQGDQNTSVILETMTQGDRNTVMAQRYIPAIRDGDKRLLLINGEPIPYALARLPAEGELRGNLAAGGSGVGRQLTARDAEICAAVGPTLKQMGIVFAGLDVIGDYLTEINVTSPTCIRELDAIYGVDIAGQLMDCVADSLAARQ